ncbi:MAG: alpha/beta hydrolase [Xanthobacteraceae bacterium]|jgi:pimeloyl-ACP methyl ester carboxylesterase
MNETSPHLLAEPNRGAHVFVSAQDGLRLHVREYGTRGAPGLAVVCLPGITRTVADFEELAPALAAAPTRRRVIAIDSRGRGRSEYDSNPENYNFVVELGDIVSVLTALAIGPGVFIGSSRGGVLTMLLGAAHPTAIAGVVLHDVGPVVEPKGLARIKSYLGKLPQPHSFEDGADILRRVMSTQFPNLTAEQWLAAARRAWQMKDGALVPTYDVRLARTLASVDIERPIPSLWNEYDTLAGVPMLVIRGGNSDILSAETVRRCGRGASKWKSSRWPTRDTRRCSKAKACCAGSSASSRTVKSRAAERRQQRHCSERARPLRVAPRPSNPGLRASWRLRGHTAAAGASCLATTNEFGLPARLVIQSTQETLGLQGG